MPILERDAVAQSATAAIVAEANGSPVIVHGQWAQTWEDDREQISVVRGNAKASNGAVTVSGQQLVVWRRRGTDGEEVIVYGERVRIVRPGSTRSEPAAMVAFSSQNGVQEQFDGTYAKPARHEEFFKRAIRYRRSVVPDAPVTEPEEVSVSIDGSNDLFTAWQPPTPQSSRRVQIRPRTSAPFNLKSRRSDNTIPPEQIAEISGGVKIIVDGFTTDINGQQIPLGLIDLAADRMVVWTVTSDDLAAREFTQASDTPLQVYMEGNIEIRQGGNILTATHGFFDVQNDRALLLNGELRAYLPSVDGQVRVRAERIRQSARTRFHAQNAWVTTSPYGKPGFRLEASDIFVEPRSTPPWLRTRQQVDSQFGLPQEEALWITSLNNRFVIGDTPVLALPRISGPAASPGLPVRRASVRHDNIFGLQVKTVWDLSQVLGMEKSPGLDWNLHADYYSERGPGIGTSTEYKGLGPTGQPYRGEGLIYYLNDAGHDTLGRDRRRLDTDNNRGRAFWRHRQELPNNVKVFGEIGYLSDRNFLEQYYESEFDREKDQETSIRVKQDVGNFSGSLFARPQVNPFETTTEWLPKLDVYGLSQPLFGGALTWSNHSSIGYARLRPADAPSDPNDVFSPLPFVTKAEGLVTMTRHELDAPFNLGPIKLTPFVMGEVAYWEEGFTGASVDRSLVSAGARANMVVSRVYPFLRSPIFNLNGLAHKIEYNLEARYTDSSESLNNIPQFNEIDDNAQERFRYRLLQNTFGGALPGQFDPRSFALRNGAGFQVTAPYHELVDDQQVIRASVRHRLQTKVGPATNPRVRDWMTWESGFTYFPKPDRDNFGDDFGLFHTRYQWHVGERTSVIANTLWDTFDGGQRVSNIGLLSQRSRRGSVYVGYRSINGTQLLDSDIVTASFSYAMSPKWVMTGSTAYDFGERRDQGQSFTVSRIGLDWIFHFGANYDRGKDNVGLALLFEPRFGSTSGSPMQLNSLLGVR
ncbi:MAG: hypothetical protein AB8G99_13300 [Planctomycetaceae bacterium]